MDQTMKSTKKHRSSSSLYACYISILVLSFSLQKCSDEKGNSVAADDEQPNIIFIMADDLGYGDLGSYGQSEIQTPHLDQLADEGMRFLDHYAGSTVCAPSRSVLMTGLHTGHTPIRGNLEFFPIGQYPMPYAVTTLPQLMKEAGYSTGGFGKWGLGYPDSEGRPSLHGFDEFFGYLCQRRSHFYYPEYLFRDIKGKPLSEVSLEGNEVVDNPERYPGSGQPVSSEVFAPDVINQEALRFMEENKNGPFFMYVPSLIPHASLEVPEEELTRYLDENGESKFEETPHPEGEHYSPQPFPKATYAAMISRLDRHVGQILDKLDELGIADNTLIIFTSDNGSYSEGGYHYSMFDSNSPLRGGKRDLYEGGIRVPMIARWPGKIEAGSISEHISIFQDMMPTFGELAGISESVPSHTDGISLVPTLLGQADQAHHDYLYWEFHEEGGKQAVRMGEWKAVRLDVREDRYSPIELYNLKDDIAEEKNIAGDHPGIVEKMEEIIEKARVPSEVFSLFTPDTESKDWLLDEE